MNIDGHEVNVKEVGVLEKFEGDPKPENLVERVYVEDGTVVKVEKIQDGEVVSVEKMGG